MKANKLMIGDWMNKRESDHYIPVIIEGIYEDNVDYRFRSIRGNISIEGIEPIPITPEILEKNGFEFIVFNEDWKKEYTYKSEDIYIYVVFIEGKILVKMETKSKGHIGVNNLHSCDIKYIHELQHALKLCGIEKEIKVMNF